MLRDVYSPIVAEVKVSWARGAFAVRRICNSVPCILAVLVRIL